MKSRYISFALQIVLSVCFPVIIFSQTDDVIVPTTNTLKMQYKVVAVIIDGDTLPSFTLQEFTVYGDFPTKNKRQYEAWTRIKYNVKKVYPYAVLASAKLKEYNVVLEKLPDEKSKKLYMKVAEKELKAQFEDQLKDLTMSQGRILLKLIDRETGNTSYQLVKDFRGGFQAFMWQGVARLFGNNMKAEYDPQGEDIMIERAIKLVEAGQF
jgi:hypothetical protein